MLLVEDEPLLLRLGTQMLELQGYDVIAATSPEEAIRAAKKRKGAIHLLITDVIMPEMNGLDLARELTSVHPELKCLYMSGYTADVISPHGVLDEGVHFIQKPFTMEVIPVAGPARAFPRGLDVMAVLGSGRALAAPRILRSSRSTTST